MDNVAVETKELYEKTMEARLRRLGARIDDLQVEVEEMGAKTKVDFYKWIEELRDQQVHVRNKFREMKNSSGEIWLDLKSGLENSARDLKEALDKIAPKIKNFPRFNVSPTVKWIGLVLGGVAAGYFIGRFIHKNRKSI
jgi:hypothetical protein